MSHGRLVPLLAAVLSAATACAVPHPDSPATAPPPAPASAATTATPTAAATPSTLTVLGAGDVLVHPPVWAQARADGGGGRFDFGPMFAGVAPTITGADLAICHLETPLAPAGGPYSGWPRFSVPPQVVRGVKEAGFDSCSTASNHSLDQGVDGVRRTLDDLDAAGIAHAGTARSAAEAAATTVIDVHGVRVAHLAYSYGFNGLSRPPGRTWLANLIDPAGITAAAREARRRGADIVVLSMHWGTEYRHEPDADQVRWARQIAAGGQVDLILGHHAHVVQPIEKIGDTWVVYGMGNELARHAGPVDANREGVMARVTFTRSGPYRWRVTAVTAIPTWTEVTPRIRLVNLPAALGRSDLPRAERSRYQAAYDRVAGYLRSRGAGEDGLMVAAPGG